VIYDLYHSYFFERHDDLWRSVATEKLSMMIKASEMLICGEDLGMIPSCVQGVLDDLSLLGLRVQRMPKDETSLFEDPSTNPYTTVSTPSVHDSSTLRGWWEENYDLTQLYYNQLLGFPGDAPRYCEPWIVEAILNQHLTSPSLWSIFLIQDFFGLNLDLRIENPLSERINNPAVPHYYWRYRIHVTLEDLLVNYSHLTKQIRGMIVAAGRAIHENL